MKIIFNTAPINSVGVKIYFDGYLMSECIVKGGINPVYIETDEFPREEIILETCYESEIKKPATLEMYCKDFNSKLYGYDFNGAHLDGVGKLFKTSQFIYKTIIKSFNSRPKEIMLDFIDVDSNGQCGLCIRKIRAENNSAEKIKHIFVRKCSRTKILIRLGVLVAIQMLLLIMVCGTVVHKLFVPLNNMSFLTVQEHRILMGDVLLVALFALIFPALFLGNSIYRMYWLLKKEVIETFIEQI